MYTQARVCAVSSGGPVNTLLIEPIFYDQIPLNCAAALTYDSVTQTFGCNSGLGTGSVTSVATGAGLTGGPITTTGTISLTNTATTVNGQTCTLGSTCTVPAVTSVTCNGGLTGGAITTAGTCAVDTATNSNIWAGASNKIVDAAGNVSSQVPQPITISTATFTPDFNVGLNFDVVLVHASCPCTIANPTNIHQNTYFLTIVQSGTGSDTIGTWGSFYKFPGGVAPTLSTAAGAVDIVPITCRNTPGGAATINFCMVGAIQQAFR